jgi:nitrile hydratase
VTERFGVGDRVRARTVDPAGHCRLPRYARGHHGTVVALHGASRLPDAVAAGRACDPEPVYAVRFDAQDLWGSGTHTVTIELWQSYLEG